MIEIGGRKIGYGYAPILSAELSISHGGHLRTALRMIDSAKENGADGVKLQFYKTEDFAEPDGEMISYQQHQQEHTLSAQLGAKETVTTSVYNLFKKNEISLDFVKACQQRAKEHQILFGVTTTSVQGVKEMADIGVDYFKVASDMFDKIPMIEQMKQYDIPMIVSTGHMEIRDILKFNCGGLMLHCVSEYPAKNPKLWRLRAIPVYGYEVGYSHHSVGITDIIRATELGSVFNEFHFTLDKTLPGSDHWWSLDPSELKQLVKAIK